MGEASSKTPKKEKENFFELIKELENVKGIQRYRISSIEPNLLTNEIIEFVANSDKFMPHFHIPLAKWQQQDIRADEEKIQERIVC